MTLDLSPLDGRVALRPAYLCCRNPWVPSGAAGCRIVWLFDLESSEGSVELLRPGLAGKGARISRSLCFYLKTHSGHLLIYCIRNSPAAHTTLPPFPSPEKSLFKRSRGACGPPSVFPVCSWFTLIWVKKSSEIDVPHQKNTTKTPFSSKRVFKRPLPTKLVLSAFQEQNPKMLAMVLLTQTAILLFPNRNASNPEDASLVSSPGVLTCHWRACPELHPLGRRCPVFFSGPRRILLLAGPETSPAAPVCFDSWTKPRTRYWRAVSKCVSEVGVLMGWSCPVLPWSSSGGPVKNYWTLCKKGNHRSRKDE